MKIAFILGGLRYGGYEILNVRIANELAKRGLSVWIFSLSDKRDIIELVSQSVNVIFLNKRYRFDLFVIFKIIKFLRTIKPSVLLACDHLEYLYPRLSTLLLHKKPKFIMAFHVSSSYTLKDHYWNKIYSFLNKIFKDQNLAIHKSQIDFYTKNYGISKDRFHLIYNGIDTEHFRHDGKKEFMPNGIIRLVHVASLKPLKDQWTLLKAMVSLDENMKNWELNIAGADVEGLLKNYKAFVKNNGIGNKVNFLGTVNNIKELLEQTDVFLLTSTTEALPVSIIEAIAMKCPVIGTNVGGIPEIISDGQEGYLIEPGDYKAIASKINFLYNNSKILENMGEKARKKAVEKFDFNKMVNEYIRLFEKLST